MNKETNMIMTSLSLPYLINIPTSPHCRTIDIKSKDVSTTAVYGETYPGNNLHTHLNALLTG